MKLIYEKPEIDYVDFTPMDVVAGSGGIPPVGGSGGVDEDW